MRLMLSSLSSVYEVHAPSSCELGSGSPVDSAAETGRQYGSEASESWGKDGGELENTGLLPEQVGHTIRAIGVGC